MIGTRRITRRGFPAAAGLAAVGASLSLTGCGGSVSDGPELQASAGGTQPQRSSPGQRWTAEDDGSCFC